MSAMFSAYMEVICSLNVEFLQSEMKADNFEIKIPAPIASKCKCNKMQILCEIKSPSWILALKWQPLNVNTCRLQYRLHLSIPLYQLFFILHHDYGVHWSREIWFSKQKIFPFSNYFTYVSLLFIYTRIYVKNDTPVIAINDITSTFCISWIFNVKAFDKI